MAHFYIPWKRFKFCFIFYQDIFALQLEGGMTNFQGLYKTIDTLNRAKLKM